MNALPSPRPAGTLDEAIAAKNFTEVTLWAQYLDYWGDMHMRTINSVCRVVEEIGYVLSGERYEETESVWNVAAAIARERGSGALVAEVQKSYDVAHFESAVDTEHRRNIQRRVSVGQPSAQSAQQFWSS